MIWLKVIFNLPTMLLQWVGLLLPFSPKLYYPATETEQEISQHLRNRVRLVDYHAKKTIYGVKRDGS